LQENFLCYIYSRVEKGPKLFTKGQQLHLLNAA